MDCYNDLDASTYLESNGKLLVKSRYYISCQIVSKIGNNKGRGQEGLTLMHFLVIRESNTGNWEDAMVIMGRAADTMKNRCFTIRRWARKTQMSVYSLSVNSGQSASTFEQERYIVFNLYNVVYCR